MRSFGLLFVLVGLWLYATIMFMYFGLGFLALGVALYIASMKRVQSSSVAWSLVHCGQ
jgi:hypothetical protein